MIGNLIKKSLAFLCIGSLLLAPIVEAATSSVSHSRRNIPDGGKIQGSYDWVGGNVHHIKVGGDISAAVTAATAGDTIELGSGTFTLTTSIAVNKKLHIKGQGENATKITTSSDVGSIFNVTGSGAMISNMELETTYSGLPTNGGLIFVNSAATVENVKFTINMSSGSGTRAFSCVDFGASAVLDISNCTATISGPIHIIT